MTALSDAITGISGLVWYGKLDEGTGTSVIDYSGNGNDGSVGSAAKRTAAGLGNIPGKATQFGYGSSSRATIPHSTDFDIGGGSFSIVHVKRFYGHENPSYFHKINGYPGVYLGCTTSGSDLRPDLRVWGGNTVCVATSGISDIHKWHVIIWTWDGSTAKIYIDGVDVSGPTTAPSPSFSNGTEDMQFGGDNDRDTLCHVAIYNTTLDTGDVATIQSAFDEENVLTPLSDFVVGIHQDLGYNGTKGQRDNAIIRLRNIHATVSRNSLLWHQIESTEGTYDWSRYDDIFSVLTDNNMKMHGYFIGSPTWVNGGSDQFAVPGTGEDSSFADWLTAYETFVEDFVNRYGESIWRYSLWNEPNLSGFWSNDSGAGGYDATQYRAWYNSIRSTILGIDSSAKISFAGLSSWSATGVGSQEGEGFFRDCMAAGSMNIDYFAYHPYTGNNDPDTYVAPFNNTFYGDITHIRDVLLEFGYDIPILLSEFGFDSGVLGETTQKDYLQHALEGARDELRQLVEYVCVYIDHDYDSVTAGLYADMPSDGSSPTEKEAVAMYETFAEEFDVSEAQFLLPSSDSVDGSWTDDTGGTDLAQAIDEDIPFDLNYIQSDVDPSTSGCRVKLASGTDPSSSSGHVIHWRINKDVLGDVTDDFADINATVKLYQGGGDSIGAGTLIASFSRNNVDYTGLTTYDETLSGTEADSITDYSDLYLEFFADTV